MSGQHVTGLWRQPFMFGRMGEKMELEECCMRRWRKFLSEQNILNLNACIAYVDDDDPYLTKNSVEFHNHMGYRFVGRFRRCGYKFGRWYDLVWMEKYIGEHVEKPEKVIWFDEMKYDKMKRGI